MITESLEKPAFADDAGRRALLRHTLATLAYRGGKVLQGAPADFAELRPAPGSRSPAEILAHMGDLLDWALGLVDGRHAWHDSAPLQWDREVARFFAALASLDARLARHEPLAFSPEGIFQGPVADALTHVGQLAMLRRLAGAPVRGENYARAAISAGKLGPGQSPDRTEFD